MIYNFTSKKKFSMILAMANIQIDDDIYDGYNDYPSIYSIKDFEQDELFQETLNTSYAKRLIVSDKYIYNKIV